MAVAELTRKKSKITQFSTEIVHVTPGMAEAWLETNTENRKRKPAHIANMARDMKSGAFVLSGESIKFDQNGQLIDGQHRLCACIEADVTFQTLVVYGLPRATRGVIDTGKFRNFSDVLAMDGYGNTTATAATLRILAAERDNAASGRYYTQSELKAALTKHKNIGLYVLYASDVPRGISAPAVSYVRYVASTIMDNPKTAMSMIEVFKTGIPAYAGCPIHKYRERFMRSDAKTRMLAQSKINTLKRCWNAFAKGDTIESLRVTSDHVKIDGLNLKLL